MRPALVLHWSLGGGEAAASLSFTRIALTSFAVPPTVKPSPASVWAPVAQSAVSVLLAPSTILQRGGVVLPAESRPALAECRGDGHRAAAGALAWLVTAVQSEPATALASAVRGVPPQMQAPKCMATTKRRPEMRSTSPAHLAMRGKVFVISSTPVPVR